MKKILLILFLLIPSTVLGLGIKNYYINATVISNSDLEVEEYFEMDGYYNGMERIINYKNNVATSFNPDAESYGGSDLHNGTGMKIEEVRSVDINDNFDFKKVSGKKFKLVDMANKGNYGVYTMRDNYSNDGKTIKIFLPSKKKKAFYIKYRLYNMAILHNDVGELGWNAIGSQFTELIENLVIYINVPNNQKMIKVWAHGPLNGESEILSSKQVKASIKSLEAKTPIDVRVVFDKEVLKDSFGKSNVDALNKILKYEQDLADQANEKRKQSDEENFQHIKVALQEFEECPSRNNYNEILKYVNLLTKSETKDNYFKLLETLKSKVDKYEYKEFKKNLKEKITIENYNKAKENKDNVFNISLQEKMNKELKNYYKKLQKEDLKKELIFSLISLITILISIFVYKNPFVFKKRINPFYFRDIPSYLSPAAVGILIDKKITKNEISASILDLVRRKIITVKKLDNGTHDFILEKSYEELEPIDKKIASMIFPANSNCVNSKKIKKISSSRFKNFKNEVIEELQKNVLIGPYEEEKTEVSGILLELALILLFTPFRLASILFILLYSILRYNRYFYIWLFVLLNIGMLIGSFVLNSTVFHVSIFISIFAVILIKVILRRFPVKLKFDYTDIGKEERVKWHGLRNFLIDFSKIDDRDIKEVSVWEEYLVYATALGVGKKVLNAIKLKIEQQDIDYETLDTLRTLDYISFNNSRISNSFISSSQPSVSFPILSSITSGSSFSSGSGGGGGFSGGSSGGGSFGGGGGGGRF